MYCNARMNDGLDYGSCLSTSCRAFLVIGKVFFLFPLFYRVLLWWTTMMVVVLDVLSGTHVCVCIVLIILLVLCMALIVVALFLVNHGTWTTRKNVAR